MPLIKGIATGEVSMLSTPVLTALDNAIAGACPYVRQGLTWNVVETSSGVYDWTVPDQVLGIAAAAGLKILCVLNGANMPSWATTPQANISLFSTQFAAFCAAAVARYQAAPYNVVDWEIWNEPNLGANWNGVASGSQYAQVVAAAYTAMKAVQPTSTICIGAISPAGDGGTDVAPYTFMSEMYANVTQVGSLTTLTLGTLGASVTATGLAPVTTHDLQIVLITNNGPISVSSLSGGGCTTWTSIGGMTGGTSGWRSELWMGVVTSTGASTLTINFASTVAGYSVHAAGLEFVSGFGAGTTWAVDATTVHTSETTGLSTNFPAIAPSHPAELCLLSLVAPTAVGSIAPAHFNTEYIGGTSAVIGVNTVQNAAPFQASVSQSGSNWFNMITACIQATGSATTISGAFDAISVHPYCYGASPLLNLNWSFFYNLKTWVYDVMTANGDGAKPVWITEFGDPSSGSYNGYAETLATQASNLSDAFTQMGIWTWIAALFYFDWSDALNSLLGFGLPMGLLDATGAEKPAYLVFTSGGTLGTVVLPLVTWFYADAEADRQATFRVLIFNETDVLNAGFNINHNGGSNGVSQNLTGFGGFTPVYDSGDIASSNTSFWIPPGFLVNEATYRAFVIVTDVGSNMRYPPMSNVGTGGPNAGIDFSPNITAVVAPTVGTPTFDPVSASISVPVTPGSNAGTITSQELVLESSADGENWNPVYPVLAPRDFLRIPGSGYASTPATTANQILGDLDIRIYLSMDTWAPADYSQIMSQESTSGGGLGWLFDVVTGKPSLGISLDGTAGSLAFSTSTAAPPFSAGQSGWLRVTRGAASGTVTFFSSTDGVHWTQLGATRSSTPGNLFPSTQPIRVGNFYAGGYFANVFYAEVRDGISGAVVVNPDFTSVTASPFTDGKGNSWTVTAPSVLGKLSWLRIPGGGLASCPNSAALQIAGDVDIRAQVALDNWILAGHANDNMIPADASSFEGGVSTWYNYGGSSTIAQSTAQALDGTHSLSIQSPGGGSINCATADAIGHCVAGQTYTLVAAFRAAATPRVCSIQIVWTNNGSVISSGTAATVTDTTTGWSFAVVSCVAPANATSFYLFVSIAGTATSEIHYMDCVGVFPGNLGYELQVLQDAPVGYWKLNEASGTNVLDYSGNGRTLTYAAGVGTILGGTSVIPTYPSEAMASMASGATAPVSATITSLGLGTGSATFEAFVKPTTLVYPHTGFPIVLATTGVVDGSHAGVELSQASTSSIQVQVSDGTHYVSGFVTLDVGYTMDTWVGKLTHVAVVLDRSANLVRIYVNGHQNANTLSISTVTGSIDATVLSIGGVQGWVISGYMGQVAIYKSALSSARILAHYQAATVAGSYANTWSLGVGLGSTQTLVSKAANLSYNFLVQQGLGLLTFTWSVDGTTSHTVLSTVPPGFANGTTGWVRITRVQSTGVITFYTSPDGQTWTQLGTTFTEWTGAIHYDTSTVDVGSDSTTSITGNIFYVEIRNGVNGTIVASPSFFLGPVSPFVDANGNTWTITPPAYESSPRTFVDYAYPPLADSIFYRSRVTGSVVTTPGNMPVASPNSSVSITQSAPTPGMPVFVPNDWMLIDPQNPGDNISIQVKKATYTTDENQTVLMPVGRGRKVVIGDTPIFGDTINLELLTVLPADFPALVTQYSKTYPLILRSGGGEMWWVRSTKRGRELVWQGTYRRPFRTYTLTFETVDALFASAVLL